MKKNQMDDFIRRELTEDPIAPAPDSFYDGVWKQIRNQENRSSTIKERDTLAVPFGTMCWRLVPVFSLFLLAVSVYSWYFPAESIEQATHSAESYVLDTGDAPSSDELLYQILFPSDNLELEENP